MAAPSQSPIRPVLRVMGLFTGVMALVIAAQVVLNPPERRPYVVSWPLYLTCKFFSVTVVQKLMVDEHLFALENLARCERLHDGCVRVASKIPGFRAGSSGLIDRLREQGGRLASQPVPGTNVGDDDDE